MVHFTKVRAAPLDGHRGCIDPPPLIQLGAELLRHSRDAHAFGGDDGPVPHVVFWYLYDNRENLLPGRVRDWDRDGLGPKIIYNLHVTLDWLQKLDGRRREDVFAESDRRVDDARVGGDRLCRWGRLIHDGTTEMSGGGSSWSRCGLLFGVGEKKKRVSKVVDIYFV